MNALWMLLQDLRMSRHRQKGLRMWKWHFLIVLWILMLANPQPSVLGYFLGDIKAVLNGCEDHWTLQESAEFPASMTVCINIRVVVPGPWIAFTYSSVHGLMPELGLEGDKGALYVWLLRVKHRFPLKLTEQDWHQICLRRDVVSSSFSLEVDNQVVGHRVVIAQAIPSYGSLWLGCGQRDQPTSPAPGQVELYLFRVWADLKQHLPCEDGSVISWSSENWGVTSAKAREKDNDLPCVITPASVPQELKCHIDQLCSNVNPYFWVPVSVENKAELLSEKDIHEFVKGVFTCDGTRNLAANTRSDFHIFCLDVSHIEVKNVSCLLKEPTRQSQCGILLQLSSIVSVCKLRQAALSALQQTTGLINATITGAVERVGRNICDDVDPSSGGFVTCSSSLSLEEMCQSKDNNLVTCNELKPDYILNKVTTTDSCTSETTRFCDCTSFCNHQNHFYAQKLDVTNFNVGTKSLQNMLTDQVIETCGVKPNSQCLKSLKVLNNQGLKKTYVNCHKMNERSYSCMMILEMNKRITDCSVITVLQTLINNAGGVTTNGSLTHMEICGDFEKPTDTLLTSNLTWFTSNLKTSDICEVGQTRLKCASNENLAVLLSDPCQSDPTTTVPPKTSTRVLSTTTTTTMTTQTTQAIPTTSTITTSTTAQTTTTQANPTTTSTTPTTTATQTTHAIPTTPTTTTPQTTITQTIPTTTSTTTTTTTTQTTQAIPTTTSTTTTTTTTQTTQAISTTTSTTPTTTTTQSTQAISTTTSTTPTTNTTQTTQAIPTTTSKTTTTTTPQTTTTQTTQAIPPITSTTPTTTTTQTTTNKAIPTTISTTTTSQTTTTQAIPSTTSTTTTTQTTAKTTQANFVTTTANTITTAAPTTGSTTSKQAIVQTESSVTPYSTLPNITNKLTHNTEGTMQQSTEPTKSKSTTISFTFETASTKPSQPTETTLKTDETTTLTLTQLGSTTVKTAFLTTSNSSSTTTSTVNHTASGTSTDTTASTETTILDKTTKVTTTSTTSSNTNETSTLYKSTGITDKVSRTSTASIRPETDKTITPNTSTIYNTFPTRVTAKISDTTFKEKTPNNTTSNIFYSSTLANDVKTTATDTIHTSPIANTVDNTSQVNIAPKTTVPSTIYTTTAATIISNTHGRHNITNSTSTNTTTIANILNGTSEVSTTTTSATVVTATVAKTYHTSSSQTTLNKVNSTSDTTNATLPTVAPNVITAIETTAKTLITSTTIQTTQTPLTKTDNPPSTALTTTNLNETLKTFIPRNETRVNTTTSATPITSTSIPDATNTLLPSTTTNTTTMNALIPLVSDKTTFATTKETMGTATTTQTSTPEQTTTDTTTSAPFGTSTQQVTSLSEKTKTNTGTTQQSTSNTVEAIEYNVSQTTMPNITAPTTPLLTLNGSLVDNQTTTGPTTLPGVTPHNKATQSRAFTSSTMSPTSTVKYNVTTGTATVTRNISALVTSNYTGVDRTLNNTTTGSTTITTTTTIPAASEVHSATTIEDKITTVTLGTVTTSYTPVDNTTKDKHGTDTSMATTTATSTNTHTTTFTPITNHTTGYNVTKALYNQTMKYNVSTTSVQLLKTTLPSDLTTTNAKHTSSIHTATTSVHKTTTATTTTPEMTTQLKNITASTQTIIATQKTTQATTVSPTRNITAHLTTLSMKNISISTTISPTIDQTTISIIDSTTASSTKPQSSQSATIPTTNTIAATTTATTMGPQQTEESTTTTTNTTEASRTSLQTSTTSGTTNPETGLLPTTTTEQTTRSQQELEQEADNLLSETEDVSRLNSSQVSKLVGLLGSLLDGPSVSQAVGKKAINIISNLMEGDAQALSASANRLVRLVDKLGLKLEVSGESEILSSKSLVLAVQNVDASKFSTTTANIFNTDNVQINARTARSTGAPLGSVFLPSSLTEGLSPEEEHWANRVQFTFYTKSTLFMDSTLNNQTVVSPVLASSVANVSIRNLREDIEFTIRNINPMKINHSTSCVFWDFTENGGDGGWNNAGCYVIRATAEDTTCSCNHLTSFAVLLDLSRDGITDRKQAQLLTFITYIGCGVSAVFLSVTILTYLSFEKLLRDIPAKILVQLCISLLLLNLVFLIDGWLAQFRYNGLCITTAFFLHYFLLTSFTWAGLEALHMYLSIVRVFTPYLSKYMMKFSIMGWGIPLIVVVIIIAVDRNNYGLVTYGKYSDGTKDDFCWLLNDLAFYIGVVAYFLLIFAFSLIVFVVVLVQLARIKRQNPHNQSPNRGVLSDLRSISGLVILLGLTWGFALFAWGPLYLPFVYLFSIFNSLQGFFVFVFHCAIKENVQRQWRTYLCCGRLRLPENSEWSRTATHNNKNTSFTMMSSSAAHLASSSASVVSETNSSGSVYADSGISDGSNSDVVLNEIHRRNMTLQGHL